MRHRFAKLLAVTLSLFSATSFAANILINGTLAPNGTFSIVNGPVTHQSYSNGTRPVASTFSAGTTIWNTTSSTLQVSDGVSTWSNVGSSTLQSAYTAGGAGGGTFTLTSSGGGLIIKDAATPIGGNLFAVLSNDGLSTYFAVTAATGTTTVLTLGDGSGASVSSANTGNLRYNNSIPAFQVSLNGAAYDTIATLTATQEMTNKTLTGMVVKNGLTASGSTSNNFSGSTGDFAMSTGALSWAGASGKTASLVATSAAMTITAAATSTWSTTVGNLTIDAAGALNLGSTNATGINIGHGTTVATTVTGLLGVNTTPTVFGLQNFGNGFRQQALTDVGTVTVTPNGATGSTTWAYYVAAVDTAGNIGLASPLTYITNGNATLTGSNFNALSWAAVTGAANYKIYRFIAGGTPSSTGLVTTQTGTTFNDVGTGASLANATRNSTADATIDGAIMAGGISGTPSAVIHLRGGGILVKQLATASAPTVTPQGTTGAATWTYRITAIDPYGNESPSSNTTSTATGNATLTTSNFNRITWAAVTGAAGYKIIRSASGGTPSTTGILFTLYGANTTFDDTGYAASAYTVPTINLTGTISSDGAMISTYGFSTEASASTRITSASNQILFNAAGNTLLLITTSAITNGFNQDLGTSGAPFGNTFLRTASVVQPASGAGAPSFALKANVGAHTALTSAATYTPFVIGNAANLQWAMSGGTVADEPIITMTAPNLLSTTSGTFTKTSLLQISGPPVQSTNSTVTQTSGLEILAGAVGTAATASSLHIVGAPTGTITNAFSIKVDGGNTSLGGLLKGTRISLGNGTALVAGDFALSAGWGNTAAIASILGTDGAWTGTVTANGSGIAANPTIALTFKDGTWTTAPVCIVEMNNTNDAGNLATKITNTETATVLTITFNGTANGGSTYAFSGHCIGVQ